MKQAWKELALAAVIGWVMPWFLVSLTLTLQPDPMPPDTQPAPAVTAATQPQTQRQIPVRIDGQLQRLPLTDYLTGVLLAELPEFFHMEAKMAQAVVARTYALRTIAQGRKHPGAVCADSGCCQGYLSPADYLAGGGSMDAVLLARQAVTDTEGMVLTYGGALIDATYFSCSGGMTEDAVAVWGSDVPYLQSVESPGEEMAAHFTDTVSFTPERFCDALGMRLSGEPESWFGTVIYSQGGGVASMNIGGKSFTGVQLRRLLELYSTAFTVEVSDGVIRITTRGFGHRVGMSQYGAQAMALEGRRFEEILSHYYRNTQLEHI